MTKIDVTMIVSTNGKNIAAIKRVREITGMGLIESKTFVEQRDGMATSIRLSAERFGLLALNGLETRGNGYGAETIEYHSVVRVNSNSPTYDFSTN